MNEIRFSAYAVFPAPREERNPRAAWSLCDRVVFEILETVDELVGWRWACEKCTAIQRKYERCHAIALKRIKLPVVAEVPEVLDYNVPNISGRQSLDILRDNLEQVCEGLEIPCDENAEKLCELLLPELDSYPTTWEEWRDHLQNAIYAQRENALKAAHPNRYPDALVTLFAAQPGWPKAFEEIPAYAANRGRFDRLCGTYWAGRNVPLYEEEVDAFLAGLPSPTLPYEI